jgi:hypothetical protein
MHNIFSRCQHDRQTHIYRDNTYRDDINADTVQSPAADQHITYMYIH